MGCCYRSGIWLDACFVCMHSYRWLAIGVSKRHYKKHLFCLCVRDHSTFAHHCRIGARGKPHHKIGIDSYILLVNLLAAIIHAERISVRQFSVKFFKRVMRVCKQDSQLGGEGCRSVDSLAFFLAVLVQSYVLAHAKKAFNNTLQEDRFS